MQLLKGWLYDMAMRYFNGRLTSLTTSLTKKQIHPQLVNNTGSMPDAWQ